MSVCRTGEPLGTGELGRPNPGRESKEIEGVGGGSFVSTLLPGVVVAEFAENDGAHGGAFGGGTELPVEAETLTANATVNVLAELGSSE